MTQETLFAILDSMVDPIVFVDKDHIISYMNKAGIENYAKRGGASLLGKSIFDCHNERSKQIILEIFETMKTGEKERYIYTDSSNKKVYMRAVSDKEGNVIGYYERYE